MGQQQRGAYERREPTMGTMQPVTVARPYTPDCAAIQQAEMVRRLENTSTYIKLALWVIAWFAMLCLSELAAEGLQPRNPTGLTYFFAAVGTAAILLITFWRTVWRLMWWLIGIVIILAIIKGAFLVVFYSERSAGKTTGRPPENTIAKAEAP
ncbi:hypothetical protein [Paraburkholderia phenoliruptrix]|uniref:hypothetical protein n=1 Tax=Paraburkholderia phenoliruptrix TaxID=252970 RepID=UPI000B0086A3|nr:hypothetical protein [Paraburkholderia phenoliruptrix]